jgi:hypothetical protein
MAGRKTKRDVHVAVLGFGLIVENVAVCSQEEDALRIIDAFLKDAKVPEKFFRPKDRFPKADAWFRAMKNTNDYPDEKFSPTNLYISPIQ